MMALYGASNVAPSAVGEALGVAGSGSCTLVTAPTPLALIDVPSAESPDGTTAAVVPSGVPQQRGASYNSNKQLPIQVFGKKDSANDEGALHQERRKKTLVTKPQGNKVSGKRQSDLSDLLNDDILNVFREDNNDFDAKCKKEQPRASTAKS